MPNVNETSLVFTYPEEGSPSALVIERTRQETNQFISGRIMRTCDELGTDNGAYALTMLMNGMLPMCAAVLEEAYALGMERQRARFAAQRFMHALIDASLGDDVQATTKH